MCARKLMGMIFVQYLLRMLVYAFHWRLPDGEELNMDEKFGLPLPKAVPLKPFLRQISPSLSLSSSEIER
ncbi:hypothetical protein B296_00033743 [Ensete ventricosum]|uniref:Cytochrome P450 n=1 Tax=Ensete ventricosum TaxID=4639 RepID=A0A426X457_ENSVE|nr:hypothetical protein B296_00033743 [Ensete ventricosum]